MLNEETAAYILLVICSVIIAQILWYCIIAPFIDFIKYKIKNKKEATISREEVKKWLNELCGIDGELVVKKNNDDLLTQDKVDILADYVTQLQKFAVEDEAQKRD